MASSFDQNPKVKTANVNHHVFHKKCSQLFTVTTSEQCSKYGTNENYIKVSLVSPSQAEPIKGDLVTFSTMEARASDYLNLTFVIITWRHIMSS